MCGIVAVLEPLPGTSDISAACRALHHRGPDDGGIYRSPCGHATLGHRRLSILDLSDAGRLPMSSADGRLWLSFNGEIYNYLELRAELGSSSFRTQTDSEVLLAAVNRWGMAGLDRLIGMFSFVVWNETTREAHLVRDRFGVKPLYYAHRDDGALLVASEIKALHALGVPARPDVSTWATYLRDGSFEAGQHTFWQGVMSLPAGHYMKWTPRGVMTRRWYDLAERVGTAEDTRPEPEVIDDYRALLIDSVAKRFRSDVPVGINLSGGLDSSTLLATVRAIGGAYDEVATYTFVTGDPNYDELPWVDRMLRGSGHRSVACLLQPHEVPALAADVANAQDEPFGGIPTLAYARLFEQARSDGVVVLLDGQGMDEQWAGYDYYRGVTNGSRRQVVQGARSPATRPGSLRPDFASFARTHETEMALPDPLRDAQYQDISHGKLPRALRFNDRVSMRVGCELREPFLDHRLVELAMKQPVGRKFDDTHTKLLLRRMLASTLPGSIVQAPKRPVQTPQREWLRGPLRSWAESTIELGLSAHADWLDRGTVLEEVRKFNEGEGDNSFHIWQWISLGLAADRIAVAKVTS